MIAPVLPRMETQSSLFMLKNFTRSEKKNEDKRNPSFHVIVRNVHNLFVFNSANEQQNEFQVKKNGAHKVN